MCTAQVNERDRDILDSIDDGSQHSDEATHTVQGESEKTGGLHSSQGPQGHPDNSHRSPVWHFSFNETPEFVLRPIDVGRSTPSPGRPPLTTDY